MKALDFDLADWREEAARAQSMDRPKVLLKHLPGRHEQQTHGRAWNGGRGRRRDDRGRFSRGGGGGESRATRGGDGRPAAEKPSAPATQRPSSRAAEKPSGRAKIGVGTPVTFQTRVGVRKGKITGFDQEGVPLVRFSGEKRSIRISEDRLTVAGGEAPVAKPVAAPKDPVKKPSPPAKPAPAKPTPGGSAGSSKKAQPKYTKLEDWLDKGDVIGTDSSLANGDMRLRNIWKEQGFDAPPQIVTDAELDAAVRRGGTELWRGLSGAQHAQYADEFLNGEAFPGMGAFGGGTYVTEQKFYANKYATSGRGSGTMMRMVLSPDARTISYADLKKLAQDMPEEISNDKVLSNAVYDMGRFASMLGYDAIVVGEAETVVLNRSALIVSSKLRRGRG